MLSNKDFEIIKIVLNGTIRDMKKLEQSARDIQQSQIEKEYMKERKSYEQTLKNIEIEIESKAVHVNRDW